MVLAGYALFNLFLQVMLSIVVTGHNLKEDTLLWTVLPMSAHVYKT